MLTGSGQRSPPCKAVSNPRSTAKVQLLMTANPSKLGGTIPARPNGSLRTMAAMAAVNRSPRAAACWARTGSARDMGASFALSGDRESTYRGRASERASASKCASSGRAEAAATRQAVPRRCQTSGMAAERPRRVQVRPFPSNRRLVTAAMRAGRRKMPMYGLVDVDVTTANRLLTSDNPPGSLTAFVVASVARAAAAHPEVHAYRNWRGQLVTHHHVDVATMVEISTRQGPFAIPHLLRDADIRTVAELTAELSRVKREPRTSSSGKWLERTAPAATRIPGTIPAMYGVMARSVTARQRIGTVAVTAVGMFAGGGGFGITPLTLMSLEVIVGGMTQRPRIVDGQVAIRDVLDLTLAIDHNVVDGAPAARFAAEFRELLESAAVISPPN